MINKIKSWIIEKREWVKSKWKQFLRVLGVVGATGILVASVISPPTQEQIIQEIEIKQENYFSQHGRYWQGLSTKDLSKKPHYQDEGWNEFIDNKYLKDFPFDIIINTYKTPNNKYGYWIILENEQSIKSIGYGVEAENNTWEIIKTATTTQ